MQVDIRNRADGKVIVTAEDIVFEYKGFSHCIPEGYESDGASVPRLLWRLLSPCIDPVTLVPSIIHDYLYENHLGSRYDADYWYVSALDASGYPSWKCVLTFMGLRLFGFLHY